MKKVSKFLFLGGAALTGLSFLALFLGRSVWIPATGITIMYMGLSSALLGFLLFKSKDTPSGHKHAWAALAGGLLLYSVGILFRIKIAGSTGVASPVFVVTDYLLVVSYALLTGGFYMFLSRAGNIIDENDKLKVIWGVGIFFVLVIALIIAMEATAIFGKTTAGMIVTIYYISLDIIMLLIAITYKFAYYDGQISRFYEILSLGVLVWLIMDAIFVFRGSYGKSTSFVVAWGKIIPLLLFIFAQKFYVELFGD